MSRELVYKAKGYEFYAELVEIGDDFVEESFYEVYLSEDGDDYLFDALTLGEAEAYAEQLIWDNIGK